jgi:hypothetical protein
MCVYVFVNNSDVQVMLNEYGIYMADHRSKLLSEADVRDAFIIVPVKRELGNYIAGYFKDPAIRDAALAKIKYFSRDVSDPWRQPYDVYLRCAKLIESLVEELRIKWLGQEYTDFSEAKSGAGNPKQGIASNIVPMQPFPVVHFFRLSISFHLRQIRKKVEVDMISRSNLILAVGFQLLN